MQPFAVFSGRDAEPGPSRMMRNILAAAEFKEKTDSTAAPNQPAPARRPQSANGARKAARPASRGKAPSNNAGGRDLVNQFTREDLIVEVQELKKRLLSSEEVVSTLKSENQRLEMDGVKQQRRIEQLLHLSEGARGGSQSVRKEIEKSILVRQLKNQVTALRNLVTEKDAELDSIKRDIRTAHVKEVEVQCEEYFAEIQRLTRMCDELKEELFRERQRREWNSKLASETGEELRRELARLAAGYQHILTNINNRARPTSASSQRSSSKRPLSASGTRDSSHGHRLFQDPKDATLDLLDNFNLAALQQQSPAELLLATKAPSQPPSFSQLPASTPQVASAVGTPLPSSHDLHEPYPPLEEEEEAPSSTSQRARPVVAQEFIPLVLSTQTAPQSMPIPQEVSFLGPTSPPLFSVNDRVEAKYYNGSSWYKGSVKAVHYHEAKHSFVYDVLYDDGEREKLVLESNVRMAGSGEAGPAGLDASAVAAAASVSPPQTSSPLSTIAVVTAEDTRPESSHDPPSPLMEGPTRASTRSSEQVGLQTASCSPLSSSSSPVQRVLPPPVSLYRVGERVQAVYGDGNWYPGQVTAVYIEAGLSLYDVLYDDGDRASRLEEAKLRSEPAPAVARTSSGSTASVAASVATAVTSHDPRSTASRPSFAVGDRVVGQFSDGNWYPGQVTAVNLDGPDVSYDVLYDDGDRSSQLAAEKVRGTSSPPLEASPLVHTEHDHAMQSAVYSVGDRVEAMYPNHEWYRGMVEAVHPGERYDVLYDDGDRLSHLPASKLRLVSGATQSASGASIALPEESPHHEAEAEVSTGAAPPPPASRPSFAVGDRVLGQFSDGNWYPGQVTAVNLDKSDVSYDVLYDDGDRSSQLAAEKVRAPPPPTAARTFHVGDRVESHFPAVDRWYTGTVHAVNTDGTYAIHYDDGDKEGAVEGSRMRLLEAAEAGTAAVPSSDSNNAAGTSLAKYAVGESVEARFGAGEQWFPGKIASQRYAGGWQYAVQYSDGDFEEDVSEVLIRKDPTRTQPRTAEKPPAHVVTTNLDSFLNELSDDDEPGGIDAGRVVQVGSNPSAPSQHDYDYEEDFAP